MGKWLRLGGLVYGLDCYMCGVVGRKQTKKFSCANHKIINVHFYLGHKKMYYHNMNNIGWFQDWLQGIVARAATQQSFFAAIYESLVPNSLINGDVNKNTGIIIAKASVPEMTSGLRSCAVIGNNSQNQNSTSKNSAPENAEKKSEGNNNLQKKI